MYNTCNSQQPRGNLRAAVVLVAAVSLLPVAFSPTAVAAPPPVPPPAALAAGGHPTITGAAGRAHLRTGLHRFVGTKALRAGRTHGVRVRNGSLRIGSPTGVRRLVDAYGPSRPHRYRYGTWSSPWVRAEHSFRELVPSWSATTPRGTLVQVDVRVRLQTGRTSSWDRLARWASGRLRGFHPTSSGAQRDDVARVAVDTVRTGRAAARWQLRATLYRRASIDRSPVVASVGATTSPRAPSRVPTSRPGPARGEAVQVPPYSQMTHRGHYPRWDGGGNAWCSPSSVAMLLSSWGSGPTRGQLGWIPAGHRDPAVDHAARMSYDYRYRGTGNWSFSAAYAGTFGLDAFVVRLESMRAAERYIARGIPLVLSIAFDAGELDGSPLTSTDGHLLVLRAFTRTGRPIVNDPAAAHNRGVRRIYSRAQLEEAWLTASAGTAYVTRPRRVALPQ